MTHPDEDAQSSGDSKLARAEGAPSSRRSGIILTLFGLGAAAIAIYAAFSGITQRRSQETEVAKWTKEQAVPSVAVIEPTQGSGMRRLVLPGTIRAWYEAPLYARVPGYLRQWYFDYGAHVKKGDVLAEIETPELDARLAAAKAKLNAAKALVTVRDAERAFAETTYARWRDSPKGVVSVQEQDAKKAQYNTAVANLKAAQADVKADEGEVDRLDALEGFKKIRAPFNGVVTARETDIGALINAGSGSGPELFRVADLQKMRIFVQVPQQLSAGIHPALSATLQLPQYRDKSFRAVVATTSSAISTSARTLLVELHSENPDDLLQPGAYAQVDFELPDNPNVLQLPTSALIFRENGTEVATVGPDNIVKIKSVSLGRNLGTEVEILKGLTPSDKVVNSPPDSLSDGDSVSVTSEPVAQAGEPRTAKASNSH
jgi:RND family efflux transporter MFP subunit